MPEELWIWVQRWDEFQHYKPERDRAPAWIKAYTKQLDDDRYLSLTMSQRGLLESLRYALARAHGELPSDQRKLTRRLGERVRQEQLKALCDAGFIALLSRTSLDQRLETFYASRARARAHQGEREAEREEPMRASDAVVQDAHRSPADEHAGDDEPELDEPDLSDDTLGSEIRRQLTRLQPGGATA